MSQGARMTDPEQVRRFLLAGRAVVTVRQGDGRRWTFKVKGKQEIAGGPQSFLKSGPSVWFVSLLAAPGDWVYVGMIPKPEEQMRLTKKSAFNGQTRVVTVWDSLWAAVLNGRMPEGVEVWHEGQCGRCGRALTVPESIAMGLGPECATK